MLEEEIKIMDTDIEQRYLTGEKANRIFRVIAHRASVATNHDKSCALTFYMRFNSYGRNEAGVYYGPGPLCKDKDRENFPTEIRRLFAPELKCFSEAQYYYYKVVDRAKFDYINFLKNK